MKTLTIVTFHSTLASSEPNTTVTASVTWVWGKKVPSSRFPVFPEAFGGPDRVGAPVRYN
jgi:hypothetical protein